MSGFLPRWSTLARCCFVSGCAIACHDEPGQDVSTVLASQDGRQEQATLVRFGSALAWLHKEERNENLVPETRLTLVDPDGSARTVFTRSGDVTTVGSFAMDGDALYFYVTKGNEWEKREVRETQ